MGSGAAEKAGPTRVPKGKLALPKEAIGSGSFGQTSNPQNIHIGNHEENEDCVTGLPFDGEAGQTRGGEVAPRY